MPYIFLVLRRRGINSSARRFGSIALLMGMLGIVPVSAQNAEFETLAADYVAFLLAANPEFATVLGDHRFDHRMSDYTEEGIQARLVRHRQFLERLGTIDTVGLTEVNRVDYEILRGRIEATVFELDVLREYTWNPLVYNVGGAIYSLLARDFAPLSERLAAVASRLEAIPHVLDAARANLQNPPRIHTETAILQNPGTISLIDDELEAFLALEPGMREELEPARERAVAALEQYGAWLESDLLPRSNGDFRLGEIVYRQKLRHTLQSDLSMEEILERARQAMVETQHALYETALPLYHEFYPEADDEAVANRKAVVRAVLDELARDHPTDETVVDQARADLAETTAFVREHALMTLPDEPIEIIVMPEFQRGVAIAYCDSPGPLEENGKTFYSIAPTPADWSPDRVESFYREYNDYMLKDLTVHEAMPGHYLQLAHSNDFEAPTQVRAIFWSGPFVEGWALYAEQVMAEHGYGGDRVRMQQLKMKLRAIINAILDQSIHAWGMTEQEAMDLMMNEGFQEEGEAAGKWRRAALTSSQLSEYFVGYSEVAGIREAYEAKNGPIANWQAYHDQVLSFGSPPARFVRQMMDL